MQRSLRTEAGGLLFLQNVSRAMLRGVLTTLPWLLVHRVGRILGGDAYLDQVVACVHAIRHACVCVLAFVHEVCFALVMEL